MMSNFLMSVGSNGQINFWDFIKKNKIGYLSFQKPVTCFDFNQAGDLMVFATGYDWSLGLESIDKFSGPVSIGVKGLA